MKQDTAETDKLIMSRGFWEMKSVRDEAAICWYMMAPTADRLLETYRIKSIAES